MSSKTNIVKVYMKKQTLALVGASICLAGSFVLPSCGQKQQAAGGQMALPIAVITLEPSNAEFQSSYPATLRGKTDIAIRPQISGFITKVHVDEGQHVHQGQVLFTIDQVQFQAAVDQAQANVNSATSAVSTAEITEQNKRMLLEKNIISQTEWQLAANQLAQAKAALAQANAALVSANKNLAYTTVTAPCSGVVGVIPNREGSLVSPSSIDPLTTISDNSEMYAYFALNEKDLLSFVDEGRSTVAAGVAALPAVKLQLADGSIYPYEGKVATVSGVIDNTTGAASSRALFANPAGMLRSGNTGQIIIPRVSENVLVIPQKATYEVQSLRYVYTLNDSNITVPTQITVMPYDDGKTYVVTSGLKAGDRVVVEGVGSSVRPNMPVTPKTEQQAQ